MIAGERVYDNMLHVRRKSAIKFCIAAATVLTILNIVVLQHSFWIGIYSAEEPYDILINSYMRSGSSFLGRLLAWHPDTFYWYEPLWNYDSGVYYWGSELICVGKNICGIAKNKTRHNISRVYSTFDAIYNCNLTSLSTAVAEHSTPDHSGGTWKSYKECRKKNISSSKCLLAVENICKTSKHRATKTVRLTLDNVETILRNNQAVKAIHLFRDPRAIMNSRLTTKWFDVKESLYNDYELLEADATALCNRIIHDLRAGIRLKQKYPKRFAFVMFEDLLENQKLKSEILFRFYGLEVSNYNNIDRPFQVPEEVHVFKNRKSINKEYENYANWWRLELSVKAMVVIDRACINAVEFLGYERFYKEDDLRNLSAKAFSFHPQFRIEHLFETHRYEL